MQTTIAIPRPGADEYFEYYGKYIALVPGDDALPTLASHIESWQPALRKLSDVQGLHRYAAGKWSVKEVLNHIADGERVFAYRALRFARADQTPLPGFDENSWTPNAGSDRRTVADLVDELVAVRAASVALYRSLDLEALARRGEANGKAISVRALAWITAGHAIHHQGILRERYGLGG
ncbi:MAG TPA: DinB family protein [Candidatus Eisenbacteria bacterium]|nr:DinB family protein [Candidatus Eisenbacteria bacterium]